MKTFASSSVLSNGILKSRLQVLIAAVFSLLANQSASALGVAMSCIFPTAQMTSVMASPLLVLFRTFSGFYGKTSTFPSAVAWLQYISMYRYAFEGMVINQWSSIDSFHPEAQANWTDKSFESVLSLYDFHPYVSVDIISLIVLSFIFYFIGFIALYFRMKKAR